MPVKINTTYSLWDEDNIEFGSPLESGMLDEGEALCFREIVDLLKDSEPSEYPVPQAPTMSLWFTVPAHNEGTHEYYTTGVIEQRGYHPCDERAARYMLMAWRAANPPRSGGGEGEYFLAA